MIEGSLAYSVEEEPWEELIGGKIVAMSPRPTSNHVLVASNIHHILYSYLRGKPYTPFMFGEDLHLTKTDHFIPDGMVVCDKDKIKRNWVEGAPDLVVEVLSPSTARRDKGYKKNVYEKCGVKEYWIVNPVDRSVEQYVLEDGKFVLREICHYYPEYLLDEMTEEERASLVTEFSCALFPDLIIHAEDVFYRITQE